MLYAKSTGGFYNADINTVIPADAVEITDSEYADLLAGQGAGQVISADSAGKPLLVPADSLMSLEQVKSSQIALLHTAYQQAIQAPVSYTSKGGVTKPFQADTDSMVNLQNMHLAFEATQTVPSDFYWVAADNTQVPFTYADLQGLAQAIGAQSAAAFQHLQMQKAAVKTAVTPAAVRAVGY